MRSQKEITLREELDQKDRVDIYRNFLLYCMSGNVINIGMGTSRMPAIPLCQESVWLVATLGLALHTSLSVSVRIVGVLGLSSDLPTRTR